jgi:hypothetical protein
MIHIGATQISRYDFKSILEEKGIVAVTCLTSHELQAAMSAMIEKKIALRIVLTIVWNKQPDMANATPNPKSGFLAVFGLDSSVRYYLFLNIGISF